LWSPASNLYAWTSVLGHAPGEVDAPAYAAPARRTDLRGLPPAWLGVGTLDLFHDEGVEYARRLNESGVSCELVVVPGAFHGFDVPFAKAPVTLEFRAQQVRALREALQR
jgi:acetyl esterase/lipase